MKRRKKILAILVHTVRICIVAALLLLIPSARTCLPVTDEQTTPPSLNLIRKALPDADQVALEADSNGFWTVLNSSGNTIARVARTLPQASTVIGYRGPSEAMVLVNGKFQLIGVGLIESSDTDQHVAAVKKDKAFFQQFQRWHWSGPDPGEPIDAVSGATLTSLALAKGVLRRIGGDRPSLLFPDTVKIDELKIWFPTAAKLRQKSEFLVALDRDGKTLGRVIRTGPLADGIVGYQGPSEMLIKVDPPLIIEDVIVRSSYDNEPYVGYCKTEYGYWNLFKGKTIESLAMMDIQDAGVEGVSGATMTSMAIAETLVAASSQFQLRVAVHAESTSTSLRWFDSFDIRFTGADFGCVLILLCIPLFRFKGWFRGKRLRVLWLITVVAVIGLWSGNLISLSLAAGWSAEGIPWRLAPALASIMVVAFVSPIVGKSNPYCNHLCPHGAMQQLVRPSKKNRRHWKPPTRLVIVMKCVPGTLLVIAYLMLLWKPSTDLSSWEPFHGYLYRIAPWTALALTGATLLFSAFVPMGYCRLGCPTGRLLDHLRRTANSDRLKLADAVAVGLLALAILSQSNLLFFDH